MPTDQPPPPPQMPPDVDVAAKSAATAGKLSEAARRALAEAAARRAAREATAGEQRKELDGRDGPEPTRYGDWEKDGLISDF
ncbi:MAG: DUF1674 domain-containing protein [Hyphomicrobiales bacterium]|nr:DUF1674 domain-containing protein [Hyphomicrobiales bacterium]